MYTPEMADVSIPVQLLRDNREASGLLQVEAGWGDKVARGKEVC
jgi:hypothetical protein